MWKYGITTLTGISLIASSAYAAPLAGCWNLTPPGDWAELLQNGQNGALGNEITASDGLTYEFYGAQITAVEADTTGEWDWITTYQGGTLALTNILGAAWFTPCQAEAETLISIPEIIVKTRSTSLPAGQLEFALYGEGDWVSIAATYSGTPALTPDGNNVIASGTLSAAEICIGGEVLVDVRQGSLNVKSKGVIPVVLFGSADLNVNQIDPASIKLECAPALRWNKADVSGDGIPDLVLKFDTQAVVQDLLSTPDKQVVSLILTAQLRDGTPIAGADDVRILNKVKADKPPKPAKPTKPSPAPKKPGKK
jgi:hypothetical protein